MINSTERSDILVFNCYLCHVRFLLTCYVCSTKIGENPDISKCFENFVSQTLGVLTRIYAAELRYSKISMKRELFLILLFIFGIVSCVSNKPINVRLSQYIKKDSLLNSFGVTNSYINEKQIIGKASLL